MMISSLSDHLIELILFVSVVFAALFLKWRQGSKLNFPPGPPGWPLIGNLSVLFKSPITTIDDYYFTKWAKKYGDIYKLHFGSQLVYVLCNIDYVRQAFNNPHLQDRSIPVAAVKAYGKNAHGIVLARRHPWKVGRQFAMNLFRDLEVGRKEFHTNITSEIGRLIAHLDKKVGQPQDDIFDDLYVSISNVINGVTFGKQFDYNDMNFKETVSNNIKMVQEAGPGAIVLTNGLLCALPFGPGKRLIDCLRKSEKSILELIKERQQNLNLYVKPTNFVDAFLIEMHNNKDESTFHIENLVSCCNDLFVAGSDTTSATLSFAILFLATHPRVQENCQKELDDILGNDGIPDYSEKLKFPYLQAFIQETERLSLIVPLGVSHVSDCDQKLFGYDCPEGTAIIANMGSIFMNEAIFENPGEFKPERFLKDGCFEKSQHIIPFSVGKRVCLGEQLSRMETFLYLSHLLRRYSFRVPKDVIMPNILQGMVGVTRKPMPFTIMYLKRQASNRTDVIP